MYILYSSKFDRIYIGQTNNIRNCMEQHNSGKVRSTKIYIPWKLVHYEKFATRSEAMKTIISLGVGSKELLSLLQTENPE